MVRRLPPLLGLLRRGHGSHELRLPPLLRAEAAIHYRLLRLHRHDLGFRSQSTTTPLLVFVLD